MKSPIPDYLNLVLENARPIETGKPASYIDTLARADTTRMAVALATIDGNLYSAGDDRVEFSIQSISETFVCALAIEGYIRQCAINVNVRDLAMMAATLCNAGVHPVTGDHIIPQMSVRQVLSVMTTCGMYDAAGDWVSNVGIPAKSGVAGGIIDSLPGQVGIATFSPKLDERGNSVRGVTMCQQLSRDMGLLMMDASQIASASVRISVATIVSGTTAAGHHDPNRDRDVGHLQSARRCSLCWI
jgi:glutaminase